MVLHIFLITDVTEIITYMKNWKIFRRPFFESFSDISWWKCKPELFPNADKQFSGFKQGRHEFSHIKSNSEVGTPSSVEWGWFGQPTFLCSTTLPGVTLYHEDGMSQAFRCALIVKSISQHFFMHMSWYLGGGKSAYKQVFGEDCSGQPYKKLFAFHIIYLIAFVYWQITH